MVKIVPFAKVNIAPCFPAWLLPPFAKIKVYLLSMPLYLTDEEYSRVIQSLINLKNNLIAQGRYTDAVDDVLCKALTAKKKKVKI